MSEAKTSIRAKIPRTVWALGFVSLFMDISSEIVHGLLPLFLTVTLGASVALVGLIDGISEATASISKVFSGYISDRIGRRKPLILLGYGMGALSKPLFAIAASPFPILGARFVDRIGKGLRGAPRDALVADVTPPEIRGRAYGLRQSLDTVGALLGPLLAIGLMAMFANDMRAVFWVAVVPGLFAVILVIFGVDGGRKDSINAAARIPIQIGDLRELDREFWAVVVIGIIFTLARFSEAFLLLKANAEGLPLALTPLVLVVMNLVYSLGSYPAGALADDVGPYRPLVYGLGCLVAADVCLAFWPGLFGAFAGVAFWGGHMALTQGLLAKLVADNAPDHLRGSSFGVFNLATGVTMLFASTVAGILWDVIGPASTFVAGGSFAIIATIMLIGWRVVSRSR